MNLSHLFNMGGYGAYVWPAYGITLFVFGFNFVSACYENRQIKKQLKENME